MEIRAKQAIQVRVLSWPTPQEYNEAVQNLSGSFADPELRSGQAVVTSYGLPRPITGAFASVYRIQCKEADWAVRCFLYNFTDQRERYARISELLGTCKLPYTLAFRYLEEGIKLQGQWYPILKMQWAEGQHINQFVERNLHNPAVIAELAKKWKVMLCSLGDAGIAHGDLQHGNVLVDNKDFKLVDYDGMYVPALSGLNSNELGHRNYQHPDRSKADFGPYLDNFSAWVIYVSLVCTGIDPGLWKQLNAGDECMLFRQQDFIEPLYSRAFFALENHSSEEVRLLARWLRSLLGLPVRDIPDLGVAPVFVADLPPVNNSALAHRPAHAGLPDWLNSDGGVNGDAIDTAFGDIDKGSKNGLYEIDYEERAAKRDRKAARRAAKKAAAIARMAQVSSTPQYGAVSAASGQSGAVSQKTAAASGANASQPSGNIVQPKFELPAFVEPTTFTDWDRWFNKVFSWATGVADSVGWVALVLIYFAISVLTLLPHQVNSPQSTIPPKVESAGSDLSSYPKANLTADEYLSGAAKYLDIGDYKNAGDLYQRAFNAYQIEGQANGYQAANCLSGLGSCLLYQGDQRAALENFDKALKLYEQEKGPDSEEVANVCTALGNIYMTEHNPVRAEALYKRALAINEKSGNADTAKIVTDLSNLASSYQTMHKYRSAERYLKRAMALVDKSPDIDKSVQIQVLTDVRYNFQCLGEKAQMKKIDAQMKTLTDSILPEHGH